MIAPRKTYDTLWVLGLFVLSIAFQVYCAFFGFDASDEGYLLTFYQHFGDAPQDYAFGMQYALTCYAGWVLNSLTPGILPLRLWGIGVVMLMEVAVFLLLRHRVDNRYLALGILIQTFIAANDPKPFGYNTLSALLAIAAIIGLYEGLHRRNGLYLMMGGCIAGFSFWFRLPNLALIALLILPVLHRYEEGSYYPTRRMALDTIAVLGGYILGMGCGWLILGQIGAQDAFLRVFTATASSAGEKGGTHPLGYMLGRYAGNYALATLSYAGLIGAAWLAERIQRKSTVLYWLFNGLLLALAITFYVFLTDRLGNNILFLLNGIALFGTALLAWRRQVSPTLCAAAILMLLVLPLGSDGGFCTMQTATWLALPLGIYGTLQLSYRRWLSGAMIALAVLMCAKTDLNCYYDPGLRLEKTATIHSPFSRGIHTIPYRAEVMNPLLDVLPKYVKPGETLMAYDWCPIMNYLTDTKPFYGNPWPTAEGYGLIATFDRADREGTTPPTIVLQHFYSHGLWSGITPDITDPEASGWRHRPAVTKRFLLYLHDHHYRKVWTNGYFDILQAN